MLQDDLLKQAQILTNPREDTNKFERLYMSTTENIAQYIIQLPPFEKVLTVTASGDHLLNAICLGAKVIDAFDINPLARYMAELKVTAVEKLSYEDFMLFFFGYSKLNYCIYKDLRQSLSIEAKAFWGQAYKLSNHNSLVLTSSPLFNITIDTPEAVKAANLYTQKKWYLDLKENISKACISYHNISITELPTLQGADYDLMLFSNISDYLYQIYQTEDYLTAYSKLIDTLTLKLSPTGKMVFAYLYDLHNLVKHTDIDNISLIDEKIKVYNLLSFPSILSSNKRDAVLLRRR